MGKNNSEFEPYEMPEIDKMNYRVGKLEELWREFLTLEGEQNLDYFVHRQNIFEVVKRQDQRMHYFRVFHGLDYPCEYKYIAVECFWINTLKPFIVTDESSKIYDCPNERFSLYLIMSTIRAIYELSNKGKEFKYPSPKRIYDILYDFKYCSFSRETMIAFVETFADNYGIGIDYILKKLEDITIYDLFKWYYFL